ncbi:MAG: hypothetical protein LBT36_01940 [Oscillospiraceae bacterium]|nr:hypothetical protein [Oscillospiraceae bacterium]
MSKKSNSCWIFTLIGAAVAVVAVAAVLVVFRDELQAFILDLRDKIALKREEFLPPDESEDYADV